MIANTQKNACQISFYLDYNVGFIEKKSTVLLMLIRVIIAAIVN